MCKVFRLLNSFNQIISDSSSPARSLSFAGDFSLFSSLLMYQCLKTGKQLFGMGQTLLFTRTESFSCHRVFSNGDEYSLSQKITGQLRVFARCLSSPNPKETKSILFMGIMKKEERSQQTHSREGKECPTSLKGTGAFKNTPGFLTSYKNLPQSVKKRNYLNIILIFNMISLQLQLGIQINAKDGKEQDCLKDCPEACGLAYDELVSKLCVGKSSIFPETSKETLTA